MKKFITFLLSALLTLFAFTATGCATTTIDPNGSFGFNGGDSSNSSSGGGGENQDQIPFSVQLKAVDGGSMGSLEGIYAIWTDATGMSVYQAGFNEDGFALCYGPDGEYQVTLSATPKGYAYDPNVYYADNFSSSQVIELYPIRSLTGGDGGYPTFYQMRTTGVYRFTFKSALEEFYFAFNASYGGEFTFQSLLDITANEISPIFYKCFGTHLPTVQKEVKGGGVANTYTKNFIYEEGLSDSQEMLYKIGVETINANAFPVTIDLLIALDGEYNGDNGDSFEMVAKPTLSLPDNLRLDIPDDPETVENEETWTAAKPSDNFVFHVDDTTSGKKRNVCDETKVALHTDGYYYAANKNGEPLLTRPLYAMLTQDLVARLGAILSTDSGMGLADPMVRQKCQSNGKNYKEFISAYFERTNADGCYPVDEALKEYLYNISVSKEYFYDGNGSAEMLGYSSDAASRWLFACGYYK